MNINVFSLIERETEAIYVFVCAVVLLFEEKCDSVVAPPQGKALYRAPCASCQTVGVHLSLIKTSNITFSLSSSPAVVFTL